MLEIPVFAQAKYFQNGGGF